ncbi:hypothetical protein Ddye_004871 [Dipteronia dyeriana]|uniref:LysM domain-containing protein n=1 Tax=Dipteronia dyeriana TaxID=168575 RepID=A0AAD9XFA7_9ROSI|nr:hypothetical protein Ddye_004871 [Dipteronia dyeriana]
MDVRATDDLLWLSQTNKQLFLLAGSLFSTSSPSFFHFKRHFSGPSKNWRLQIHEVSNGQNPSTNLRVHVVKEGENLTSISKQYRVSVNSILEESTSIVDVDLVIQGEQLKIPSSAAEEIRALSKIT